MSFMMICATYDFYILPLIVSSVSVYVMELQCPVTHLTTIDTTINKKLSMISAIGIFS